MALQQALSSLLFGLCVVQAKAGATAVSRRKIAARLKRRRILLAV